MGRLEVQIRHGGGGPGEWGAVVALIAFVLLAAGGTAHKALSGVAHDVLTAVEVILWTAAGLAAVATTAGAVWIAVRLRGALRDRRASREARVPLITLSPDRYGTVAGDGDRPALGTPRPRTPGWPLPGQWDKITRPSAGDDDDRRRYS
jgi:hypothetical protein